MIRVFWTLATPIVAAVIGFMSNWRVLARWVYRFEETRQIRVRPMMGGDE